jgi:putative ABC transport system permease protein
MNNKPILPPKLAAWILHHTAVPEERFPVAQNLEEDFREYVSLKGKYKARIMYWHHVLKTVFIIFCYKTYWRFSMFKSYFITAIRNMLRQKGYSFINIMGLAIGIACCLLIVLYVGFEMSYDSYHQDADRIYRIGTHIDRPAHKETYGQSCVPMAPYLNQNFPQVEQAARISPRGDVLVKSGDKVFFENNIFYADKGILDIFTIPFIKGNPEKAISKPGTIVISQSKAKKYFGNEDPLGKTIALDSTDYLITGIVKDPPLNTHFKYDFLASIHNLTWLERWKDRWGVLMVYTYVKLAPHANNDNFIERIISNARTFNASGVENSYFFQPVKDIHLHSYKFDWRASQTKPLHLYIFSAIAALILIIASINYINLSTARFATRAKEIGVRKAVGAGRNQLIHQFMSESLLTTLISAAAAVAIVFISLPVFNRLIEFHFTVRDFFRQDLLISIICIILFSGLIAGSYPAVILSAFKPVNILKGQLRSGTKSSKARKSMVIMQFTISIILIISTLVVYRQLHYMENENLGFSKDQKLIITIKTRSNLSSNYQTVKSEFLQHSRITGATVSSGIPGRIGTQGIFRLINKTEAEGQQMKFFYVDRDFIPEYEIKLAAGNPVLKPSSSEQRSITIINEAAARAFGFQSPQDAVGKDLVGWNAWRIEGVIEDFNFVGLQEKIEPLIVMIMPFNFRYITLTISTEEISQTLSFISDKWKELFPGIPIEYYFLDEDFDRYYLSEEKTGKLVGIFALLGIFVACLGLFGLSCFMAEQRTKEIAIRKVHGAKVLNIISLQIEDFIKWIFSAVIIAWPIVYFITTKWLQSFAYRIALDVWIFILSGLAAFLIALLTVSYQSIKAATANPVDSLRYE